MGQWRRGSRPWLWRYRRGSLSSVYAQFILRRVFISPPSCRTRSERRGWLSSRKGEFWSPRRTWKKSTQTLTKTKSCGETASARFVEIISFPPEVASPKKDLSFPVSWGDGDYLGKRAFEEEGFYGLLFLFVSPHCPVPHVLTCFTFK